MKSTQPPAGVVEWFPGKTGERVYLHLKAKLTGKRMPDGTQHLSIVNLSEADADRLIANIKKDPRGYPGFDESVGGAKFYENYEAYQRWLVDEYLNISNEPDTETIKKAKEKKEKAQSFISKTSTFRPGKKVSLKSTKMAGIVPKRAIPGGVEQKLAQTQSEEVGIEPTKTMIGSLGRVTLDLVQINDNLDAIKEVIIEDYKNTKETNKKETEEYRKRIANRSRRLPKKDLGDSKKNIGEIIKPFVNGFFSGAGGAIRSLAAFNLIEAFLNGDYLKVFKSLMGIGITFIPQIATMIAGTILKSLLKGFGRRALGGGFGGGRMRTPRMRGGGGGIGKLGAALSLGTGALALGSAFMGSQQNQETATDTQDQTRLEELTAEQKGLTDKGLVSITQEDLKKFQQLNKKFEKTLDVLLSKPGGKSGDVTDTRPENTQPGTANMEPGNLGMVSDAVQNPNVKAFLDTLANVESGGKYNVSVGGATFSDMSKHPEMYNQALGSDAAGRYQFLSTTYKPIAQRLGLKDFSARSQDLAAVQYLQDLGVLDEIMKGDKSNIEDVIRRLRGSTWTGLKRYGSGQGFEFFNKRKQVYGSPPPAAPASPRNPNQVSATPSSGPRVAVVPIPQITGADTPGSFNHNGSGSVASVDPRNQQDIYGRLNRTGWNVVDVG